MSKPRINHAERRLAEAYRELLQLPAGRLVLRDILAQSGLLAPSCVVKQGGSFSSGSETFWHEGRRSIGAALVARLNDLTPHAYVALAQEIANEMVEEGHRNQAAQPRADEDSE